MRRLVSTAALAICILAAAVTAAGAQTPPIPIPIPVPKGKVHLPNEKVETFKLVIDGTAHAALWVPAGRTHARLVVQRRGQDLSPGDRHRRAEAAPELILCPVQSFDLSDNPSCGNTITDNQPWGLRVKGATFSPRPVRVGSVVNEDRCGEPPQGSAFSDDLANLDYGWATPPLLPFERIPLHKMFNPRRHAFKVEFKVPRRETKGGWGTPPLQGSTDDHGSITATVRFIRK